MIVTDFLTMQLSSSRNFNVTLQLLKKVVNWVSNAAERDWYKPSVNRLLTLLDKYLSLESWRRTTQFLKFCPV